MRVIASAAALFVLSIFSARFIGFTFLPQTESGELSVDFRAPPGTSIEKTDKIAIQMEAILKSFPEVDLVSSRIGSEQSEKNVGNIYVRLIPENQRSISTTAFQSKIRKHFGALSEIEKLVLTVGPAGSVGPGRKEVSLVLKGSDNEVLSSLSTKILETAQEKVPGLLNLDSSMKPGQSEMQYVIDRARISEFGLNTTEVGRTLRGLFEGEVASQYREMDREYDIRVRLKEEDRLSVGLLNRIHIPNDRGESIPLSSITQSIATQGPTQVTRINRSRASLIEGSLAPGQPLAAILQKLKQEVTPLIPPGYEFEFQGQAKNLNDLAVGAMVALFLATIFIYMIMAGLYESLLIPFSILMTLPLAIIGAFAALLVTGHMLDIYTMIGLLLLMGLVTKNGILLVDYAEQLRAQGESRAEALYHAGIRRFRPIMMTSVAMIAGMLPVAMGIGEVNQARAGMGISSIGGIATSTLLSLVVIPCGYILLDNFKIFLQRKFQAWKYSSAENSSAPPPVTDLRETHG